MRRSKRAVFGLKSITKATRTAPTLIEFRTAARSKPGAGFHRAEHRPEVRRVGTPRPEAKPPHTDRNAGESGRSRGNGGGDGGPPSPALLHPAAGFRAALVAMAGRTLQSKTPPARAFARAKALLRQQTHQSRAHTAQQFRRAAIAEGGALYEGAPVRNRNGQQIGVYSCRGGVFVSILFDR